jgi:hypothetical protein
VFILLIAALVAAGGGGGGGGDQEGGGSGASSAGNEGQKPAEDVVSCEMDKPCEIADATVTITKALQVDVLNTPNGCYKGNFVIIEFDYTHNGEHPAEGDEFDSWKISDSQGRSYGYSSDRTIDYDTPNRSLLYVDVQPGVTKKGVIVFEVAPDASGFILRGKSLVRLERDSEAFDVDLRI